MALLFMVLALLGKGLVWAVTVPPFDAPDEPAHYSYAQLLAVSSKFPVDGVRNDYSPDIRRLDLATLTPVNPGSNRVRLYPERAGAGPVGPEEAAANHSPIIPALDSPAAHYGPVTYSLFTLAILVTGGHGIVAQLMAARVVAVLLGIGAALAAAWAAREAGVRWPLAVAAGAMVGYQPMVSQQTSAVTTDAGVLCFSALTFAFTVRWIARGERWAALGMGVAMSCALLSKPAAAFLPPLLVVLLWPAVRRGASMPSRVRALAQAAVVAVVAVGPFLLWNHFKPSIIEQTTDRGYVRDYIKLLTAPDHQYLLSLLNSFWGEFGWYERSLPQEVLIACQWFSVVVVFLGVVAVGLARGRMRVAALLGVAGFVGCAAIAFGFDLMLWRNQHALGLQGRYFLPAYPMLVVAVVAGVHALGRRAALFGAVALGVFMIAINGAALLTLWSGYFST